MPSMCDEARPLSPLSFQFVNGNPQSDHEKVSLQKLVRTNAMNKYWRQRRKASALARPLKSSKQSLAPTNKSNHTISRYTPTYKGAPAPRSCAEPSLTTSTELVRASKSRQMSSLGIGQVDPFEVYPSELPSHVVSPALAQLSQNLLQTFPPGTGNLSNSVAYLLYQKCLSSRVLFHAFLFGQFAQNRLNLNLVTAKDSPQMIFSHLETVKCINHKIQCESTACDDENMLAVLALARTGPAAHTTTRKAPIQGPLKALQVLDIYGGALETVSSHTAGLMKMVSMRGGLGDIKLPGLAQSLSYGDIIRATQELSRPVLRFASISTDIEVRLNTLGQQLRPYRKIGKGFVVLKGLLTRKRLVHLYPVLRKIRSYTLAVHAYVEGSSEAQTLGLMADERNFTQYCLVSLKVDRQLGETERQFSLYNICRLSAAIYSLIVVFPLPPLTAPFERLGKKLREQLSTLVVDDLWIQAPLLILWATVMGAMSSIGTTDRSWYVLRLVRYTQQLKINSWVNFKECLQDFFWFESTSNVDGADLWNKIQLEMSEHQ